MGRFAIVIRALPRRSLPVPKTRVPSRKVTFPFGTPITVLTFLTVAVKVTGWPRKPLTWDSR